MPNVSSTPALLATERKPSFVQFAVPLINSEPPSPPAPTLSPWGAARHDCGHRLVLCHLFCPVPGGLVWGQIQVQFECCATVCVLLAADELSLAAFDTAGQLRLSFIFLLFLFILIEPSFFTFVLIASLLNPFYSFFLSWFCCISLRLASNFLVALVPLLRCCPACHPR